MVRLIREEEPRRRDAAVDRESPPSLAALRQIEPTRLMAMLRGELDWIVMKCLEKGREPAIRDGQRPGAGHPAVPGRRAGENKAELGGVSHRQVRQEAQDRGDRGGSRPAGAGGRDRGDEVRPGPRRRPSGRRPMRRGRRGGQGMRWRNGAARPGPSGTRRWRRGSSRAINDFLTRDLLTQAEPANNAVEDHVTLLEVLDRGGEGGPAVRGPAELESPCATIAQTYHGLASWEKAEAQSRSLLEMARNAIRDRPSPPALAELAHILGHRGRATRRP